jgi:hypothetical protein
MGNTIARIIVKDKSDFVIIHLSFQERQWYVLSLSTIVAFCMPGIESAPQFQYFFLSASLAMLLTDLSL